MSVPKSLHSLIAARKWATNSLTFLLLPVSVFAESDGDSSEPSVNSVKGEQEVIAEVRVTGNRYERSLQHLIGNNSALDESTIRDTGPQHATEVLQQFSGVWLSRGNGQESLLSIRSPVLTGAGSCEAFLVLEQGIPVRAPGFCNVNQLFDLNIEQAESIELVSGTASSLYGSRALHGALNLGAPSNQNRIDLQTGANEYQRLAGVYSTSDNTFTVAGNLAHDGGYKDESGFDQQKLNLEYKTEIGRWENKTQIAFSNIEQETAGYLQQGINAYKVRSLAKLNEFPEAYRDASSLRVASQFLTMEADGSQLKLTPYARKNEMEFLMHFLPGQPVEQNGHQSFGVQLQSLAPVFSKKVNVQSGIDAESTEGYLKQFQSNATQTGSNFLNEVLPSGNHYDFEVVGSQLAGYSFLEWKVSNKFRVNGGLRYDWIRYDYKNRLADGNLKDDGTSCGFGGCRYTRPSSGKNDFKDWSSSIGALYDLSNLSSVYLKFDRGFRAPHTSELYRLQNGQANSEVESEFGQTVELGYRYLAEKTKVATQLYLMEKENVIIQNSDREYVNGAKTRHQGFEISIETKLAKKVTAVAAASVSDHTYQNQPLLFGAGVSLKGNQIDTAPNRMANVKLKYQVLENFHTDLEWQFLSDYYLNPDNTESYPGHHLYNLRLHWRASKAVTASLHILNLSNQNYAERADFAFGNHRYFVGEPRRLLASFSWNY